MQVFKPGDVVHFLTNESLRYMVSVYVANFDEYQSLCESDPSLHRLGKYSTSYFPLFIDTSGNLFIANHFRLYKSGDEPKQCACDIRVIMSTGCKCGGT